MKHFLTFEHYATICPISSAFMSEEPSRQTLETQVDIIPLQLIDTHYHFFDNKEPAYRVQYSKNK